MKDFLINKGWYFGGTCGCTPNMDKYFNAKYPEYHFRINNTSYQLRKNDQKQTGGEPLSFEMLYAKTFPE